MKGYLLIFSIFISNLFIFSCQKNNNSEGKFIPPLPIDANYLEQKAALSALTDEINSNSSNPENYYKRAQIYLILNNIKEAKSDISEALSINKNEARFRLLNAEIFHADNDFKKAFEEVKIAEILGSKTPETYILLGDLHQKNGQLIDAKKYFAFAKEMAPFNGELYYYEGLLNTKLGDTTLAIANFNLAKKLKPRFIGTYKRLSEIYNNQGNTDLAMALTVDLAKLYPNDAENCSILAKIYQRRMNIDSALIFYKKALLLKPNMYQVSYNAGMMCLKNNYFQDALNFFENTYKFAPKTPFINTSIGMSYENLGNKAKALEYYTIAFSVNNRDFKAIEGIKRLEEKPYYVEDPTIYEDILSKKSTSSKPKADTTRIRLIEIQPKKINSPKKDSVNNKLQNSNKFPIPTIK